MTYDEPNIDMIQNALKKAQEIDVDALQEYAEQVSKIDKNPPLKTMLSICNIQDEFSNIPDPTMTDILNNPVFESQSPVTETITLNLEDTTNLQTDTFSPYDEIQKRLENLTDEQKQMFQNMVNLDWDKAIKLLTNSPTGTSAISEFNTGKPTGAFLTSAPQGTNKPIFKINTGPSLEMNAVTRGGQDTNQPITKPTTAEQIQAIIDTLGIHPEDMELTYYLQQALQISKGQTIDPTTNQPMYWKYVGRSKSLGPNAHKIDVNGNYNFILYCYDTRVLLTTDNKLVRLKDPKQYSKTVWKYVHKYIDTFHYFWVYNKNIKPMTPNQQKQCIIDFYNSNPSRNGWS